MDFSALSWLYPDQTISGDWRADRYIADLARQVLDLGGDPALLKAHSDYMRAGIAQALRRPAMTNAGSPARVAAAYVGFEAREANADRLGVIARFTILCTPRGAPATGIPNP